MSIKFNLLDSPGYETFKKTDTLIEIKKRISKLSGFPIETFVQFGNKGGTKYNPNDGSEWDIINPYNVNESMSISNSQYNSPIIENRYVYLFVDPSKSKIFESLNENQLNNDNVTKNLENNILNLKKDNVDLNIKYINLQNENNINQNKISKLNTEVEKYKKKQLDDENIKKSKKQIEINVKMNLKRIKKILEKTE